MGGALRLIFLIFFLYFLCSKAIFSYFFEYFTEICYQGLENRPHILKIGPILYFFAFMVYFWTKTNYIGLFKVFHILIQAQQFLSFLAPENLSLLIFFKNFLDFGHFEPQFSYKSFLI